jgi:hypothetical protein
MRTTRTMTRMAMADLITKGNAPCAACALGFVRFPALVEMHSVIPRCHRAGNCRYRSALQPLPGP